MTTYRMKKERECKGSIRYVPVETDTIENPQPVRVIYIERIWLSKVLGSAPSEIKVTIE